MASMLTWTLWLCALMASGCDTAVASTVTGERIDAAVKLIQEELNIIYNRYEMFKPIGMAFFLMQHNLSPRDMDLLKVQFATKILSPEAQYTMLFGGSSVTAGHDNSVALAYPTVIEKKMGPILNAVGVKLKVLNIAQGANGCLPSNWCYSSMGAEQADVVGWEQTFNCGQDDDILELMHRTAYWSKSPLQVGSVYIAASGSGDTAHCLATDHGKPYSDEDWTPSDDHLPAWHPNETTLSQWRDTLSTVQRLNGPTFTAAVNPPYRDMGVAISAFRFSQKYLLWWCKTIYGDGHSKATPNYIFHSSARPDRWSCEPEKIYHSCAIKFLRKESSVYGKNSTKRNHHPPRAHHMMRAEFFVFHYGMALLEALYAVKEDLGYTQLKRTPPSPAVRAEVLKKYVNQVLALSPNISKPLLPPLSDSTKINAYSTHRPECFTDYRPHYNKEMTLTGQIIGRNQWTISSEQLRPIPDQTFYEARPALIAANGSESGELYLSVKVTDVSKHVVLCSYGSKLSPSAMQLSMELHVAPSRLTERYVPMEEGAGRRLLKFDDRHGHGQTMHHHKLHRERFPLLHSDYYARNHSFHEDGRVLWGNVTEEHSCLLMNDVPIGQHVIGILSHLEGPRQLYLTHMVVVR